MARGEREGGGRDEGDSSVRGRELRKWPSRQPGREQRRRRRAKVRTGDGRKNGQQEARGERVLLLLLRTREYGRYQLGNGIVGEGGGEGEV